MLLDQEGWLTDATFGRSIFPCLRGLAETSVAYSLSDVGKKVRKGCHKQSQGIAVKRSESQMRWKLGPTEADQSRTRKRKFFPRCALVEVISLRQTQPKLR